MLSTLHFPAVAGPSGIALCLSSAWNSDVYRTTLFSQQLFIPPLSSIKFSLEITC